MWCNSLKGTTVFDIFKPEICFIMTIVKLSLQSFCKQLCLMTELLYKHHVNWSLIELYAIVSTFKITVIRGLRISWLYIHGLEMRVLNALNVWNYPRNTMFYNAHCKALITDIFQPNWLNVWAIWLLVRQNVRTF